MDKKPETKASAIRLTLDCFVMLRELMQHYGGRAWLEKAIVREYKKVFGK